MANGFRAAVLNDQISAIRNKPDLNFPSCQIYLLQTGLSILSVDSEISKCCFYEQKE